MKERLEIFAIRNTDTRIYITKFLLLEKEEDALKLKIQN